MPTIRARHRAVMSLLVSLLVLPFARPAQAARVIATVETVNSGRPSSILVEAATNKIYVGNFDGGTVTILDGSTNTVSGVDTGSGRAAGLARDTARSRVYVFNRDGRPYLSVIDGVTNAVSSFTDPPGKADLSSLAWGIAVAPSTGKIYVPGVGANMVGIADPVTRTFQSFLPTGDPRYLVANATSGLVYVASRAGVVVMQGTSGGTVISMSTHTIAMPGFPQAPVVDEVLNRIYVPILGQTSVVVIDGNSNTTSSLAMPVVCSRLAVSPVTHKLYGVSADLTGVVVVAPDGRVRVLPVPGARSIAINTTTNQIYVAGTGGCSSPADCLQSRVYIIDGLTNAISSLDLFSLKGLEMSPVAIAVNPVTNRIYVASQLSGNPLWVPREQTGQIDVIDGAAAAVPVPVVSVDNIEVVQSVQGPGQAVPLIAGKVTVARVYLSGGPLQGVTGALAVRGPKGGSPDPRSIQSEQAIGVGSTSLGSRRDANDGSLNFRLPQDLTGEISLQVSELRISGGRVACRNCWNKIGLIPGFAAPVDMKVKVIGLSYNAANPVRAMAPRPVDFNMLQSWLVRAYPISTLTWSARTVAAQAAVPFECEDANAQVLAIRNLDIQGGTDARTHYYGYVFDDGGNSGIYFMRGCSAGIPTVADPSIVASGPTGPPGSRFAWDRSPSWGGWYGAHELGHTYGRMHAGPITGHTPPPSSIALGPCDEQVPDPSFPYPAGQISSADGAFVGLDVGDAANNIAESVKPGLSSHDVMSYCDNIWMSNYNYTAIMTRLIAENALPAVPPPAPAGLAAEATSHPAGDYVTIVGTANVTRHTGSIVYVRRSQRGEIRAVDAKSPIRLRLIGSNDATLQELPVAFLPSSERERDEDLKGVVQASFIMRSDLKAIELIVDGKAAGRFDATVPIAIPQTEIRTPAVPKLQAAPVPDQGGKGASTLHIDWGSRITRATPLVATAQVRYDVQASADGGKTWETLAISVPAPNADIDVSGFGGGRSFLVRVVANSGFESKVIAQRSITR